ncbi:MAG: threonylcarbamoyl-AMP synthase [bacterium]|nr:threonylcarbamoyl-AMP synthase [bacterium]
MATTEVVSIKPEQARSEGIGRAIEVLRAGGLVAFPTETVYGLGARADLASAVARLREIKGRPDAKPFTVHIGRRGDLERFVPDPPGVGRRLARKGWPGPLTIVFAVSDPTTAPVMADLPADMAAAMYHQGTIGLRCPDDPIAGELLAAAGGPVVAASANRAGQAPPCRAEEVLSDLDGQVDLILDGGPSRYAKASTVVRLDGRGYELLREGVYDERTVRRLATQRVLLVCTGNTCRSPMAAGLLGHLLAEELGLSPSELEAAGWMVASAGTYAGAGMRAADEAVEVMRRLGLDISGHRSRPVTIEEVERADLIYTMTGLHRAAVLGLVPSAEARCRLVSSDGPIDDPIGQSTEVYGVCAAKIEAALKDRLTEVLA